MIRRYVYVNRYSKVNYDFSHEFEYRSELPVLTVRVVVRAFDYLIFIGPSRSAFHAFSSTFGERPDLWRFTMPPTPAGDGVLATSDAPSSEAVLPESPTRKTRIIRVHRNSNGVETSRTYADSNEPKNERTPLSPLKMFRTGRNSVEATKAPDDSSADSSSMNDKNQTSSPIKKSIVRVRRDSNGVELSRTKVDAVEDTNDPGGVAAGKELLASPTKTRLVRVRRNSLGMETSRTYVDSDGNSSQGSASGSEAGRIRMRRSSLGMEMSSHHSREDAAAPTIDAIKADLASMSPTKTRLVRVRRNSLGMETSRTYVDAIGTIDLSMSNHNEQDPTPMTPMCSPVRDANPKLNVSSPGKVLSPSKMASARGKLGAKKESMRKVLDGSKKNEILTTEKQTDSSTVSEGSQSRKKSGTGNPHFVNSPPNRSKSMMTQMNIDRVKEDNNVQSLRLLRVLLGEDLATISKESVDRALEKHADLLRFQLQQKKKLKQKDEVIEQEKKEKEQVSDHHSKEIAKLEKELKNQKMLMQTSLEIKDVEIDILKKERDQKVLKIQQLSWRLAKERMVAKSKEAQGELPSDQTATTEPLICARCQALEKDDSESSHDLPVLHIPALSARKPVIVLDDELSVETPIMGQSASSGLALSLLDNSNHEKKPVTVIATDVNGVTELEDKLRDTEQKLVKAKKVIVLLEKKKQDMAADFEETLHENKAKKAQLKAVLVACNERRKVAEQMLRDLGKFDEDKLAAISKKSPDELINEINKDSAESQSSYSPSAENETLGIQNKTLQETNSKLESQLASLNDKIKECEEALVASKDQHEDAISKLEQDLERATEKFAILQRDFNKQVDETAQANVKYEATVAELETNLQQVSKKHLMVLEEADQRGKELEKARLAIAQSEGKIKEYSARLVDVNSSIKPLETKVAELTSKLEGSRRSLEQSEKKASEYLMENTDVRLKLQEKANQLSESSIKLEESKIALKEAELQAQKYATELQHVTDALHESEALAEKYLMMLEEANVTLLQSEKLMKKYDKATKNDISDTPSGDEDLSEASEDDSAASEDLSLKSTEDLLALAAKRLENLLPVDDKSIGAERQKGSQQISKSPHQMYGKQRGPKQYDAYSVTSTPGAETVSSRGEVPLLKQWESSRKHNEDASKIAKLETELVERQLQLNDALRKIDELTRTRNEKSSVSSKGELTNEALVTALAKVSELKERVAIAESKYKEATKKLLFLKETVLTVVDIEKAL